MGWFNLRKLGVALAVLGVAACGDTEGGDTPTGDLIPDFRLISNPSGVVAFGLLQGLTEPNIRLQDPDRLTVTAGDQAKTMGYAVDPVNGSYYTATLAAPAPDEVIVFALSRGGAASAPNSSVTMPVRATILSPTADTIVTTGTNITVTWNPAGSADEMAVVLTTTECTGGGSTSPQETLLVGDAGTASIAVPPALLPPSLPWNGYCSVSLRLQRTRYGTPDPAFASGGTVAARQLDIRRILVIPQ